MKQGDPKGIEVVLPEKAMEINELITPKCFLESGSVIDILCVLFHVVPNFTYMSDTIINAMTILIFQLRNLKLSRAEKLAQATHK